ncbi:DegT/DnrJ/EryC1/StrS family aminotransferase [Methanopyrus sp.]
MSKLAIEGGRPVREDPIPIAQPILGDEEVRAVTEVLRSGQLAQGPRVEEFEREFARFVGCEHCVATSSGTTALQLALESAGLGPGDLAIVPSFTFIATANAALHAGADVAFVDIDLETYCMDPHSLEEVVKLLKDRVLRPRTVVVIPVHLYGHPADMDPILEIAEEHDLVVIEDAAQAHGAEYKGRKVGSLGDAACFSFYPTKNMTTGEGGAITTDDGELAERARMLRSHGERERYDHVELGYNFRMTDIAAAIGIVQLRKLEEFNERRRENARYYLKELADLEPLIELPTEKSWAKHVYHQFTIRVNVEELSCTRDEFAEALRAEGVDCAVHYPTPLHRQPVYLRRGYYATELPKSERAAETVLSIPVHPGLSEEDRRDVVEAVEKVVSAFSR